MPIGFYIRSEEQKERLRRQGFKEGNIPKHQFEKGNRLRRGIKMTEAQCKRISDGHKGLKKSEEVKEKIRIKQLGIKRPQTSKELNPNWRGGINPINDSIRKSIEYRLWRESVFARDQWTCQKCGVTRHNIHAHHIKQFAFYPELRFAIDNGITLCCKCHLKEPKRLK